MRTKQELKGEYIECFLKEEESLEDLKNAISEAGLHCCDHCGYITDELVRFKDYDFTQEKKLNQDYNTLCDNCYEYMYSLDFVKPIKED